MNGCRTKAAAVSPAKKRISSPSHSHAVPELLPGHDSPDAAHRIARSVSPSVSCHPYLPGQSSQGMLFTRDSQVAPADSRLQHELSFSLANHPTKVGTVTAAAAAATAAESVAATSGCVRCGVTAGVGCAECRFHPALLTDPGPLQYSPEWHACRAAGHSGVDPGCHMRHGHYFPSQAVTNTGLVQTAAGYDLNNDVAVVDCMPQPRRWGPLPKPQVRQ